MHFRVIVQYIFTCDSQALLFVFLSQNALHVVVLHVAVGQRIVSTQKVLANVGRQVG